MAILLKKDGKTLLELSETEAKIFGQLEGKNFDISKAKQGIWVLTEAEAIKQEKNDFDALKTDAKIFGLLAKLSMSERVEGKFEGSLSETEQKRLEQLLQAGKIEKFKLNPSYKKAVYRPAQPKLLESEKISAVQKDIEEYSLEKDGFLVVKNEERAKKLSRELEKEIKEGKIKGLKSFDGNYYIISMELLEKYREKTYNALKVQKTLFLSELCKKTGISRLLQKIVCEFLREDGEIIEKRKELYSVV